jgi:uncharacterized protein YndB with AHSA1/START domain
VTISTHAVKPHRVLRAPSERIYRAFFDADAMAKWLPPHGYTGKVHHIGARVGGSYQMSYPLRQRPQPRFLRAISGTGALRAHTPHRQV